MKIGVIGSVNIDFVYSTDRTAKKGETVFGNAYDILNGGKGANQAVIMSAITDDIAFLGAVGNDYFSQVAIDHLAKKMPNNSSCVIKKETTTGMAVIELTQNDNRITVIPGANLQLSNKDVIEFLDNNNDINTVVLQLEIDVAVVEFTVEECLRRNIKIILNPAPVQNMRNHIIDKVDYLIPNETEFEEIFGHSDYAKEVLAYEGKLIVTMGEVGVMFHNGNVPEIYPAKKLIPKDTTGAGDSFVAGFSSAITKGQNMRDSIELGISVASITCEHQGAQTGYKKIKELYNEKKWNIK